MVVGKVLDAASIVVFVCAFRSIPVDITGNAGSEKYKCENSFSKSGNDVHMCVHNMLYVSRCYVWALEEVLQSDRSLPGTILVWH